MNEDEWTDYEDGVIYSPEVDNCDQWLQQQLSEDEDGS